MNEQREFIDVDITEEETSATTEKHIRGTGLYFSTSQVAARLDIPDSKVRYYTKFFDDILNVEYINKQRRYTEEDIKKLQFLVELKCEGMTMQQIKNYCEEVDFDTEKGIKVKESNPLTLQAISKALLEEQSRQFEEQFKRMESLKEDMLKTIYIQVSNQLEQMQVSNEQMKEQLIENVTTTVDEILNEKLQAQEDRLVSKLRSSMEEHKIQSEQQQEKKGFFKKIFG